MVSKLEIQNEAREDIKKAEEELKQLEEEHKKFNEEHKQMQEYEFKERKLSDKLDRLIEKKWKLNFENRDNWYYSRIPLEFKSLVVTIGDEKSILEILREMSDKEELKIKETEEYKELEKEKKKLIFHFFSKKHKQIDDEIERLKWVIQGKNILINKVENKGELIKYSKMLKENEKRENERKEREKRKEELRESIIKRMVVEGLR